MGYYFYYFLIGKDFRYDIKGRIYKRQIYGLFIKDIYIYERLYKFKKYINKDYIKFLF